MSQLDPSILKAALEGLELQRQRLDAQIAQVKSLIGSPAKAESAAAAPASGGGRKKRHVSAEARARMAEAQKKRWAAARKGS